MKEEDLFEPVRALLEGAGYVINAEVAHCDVVAQKDDDLVVVELKKNLSVTLLSQGVRRQKTGARVYVAIPKPATYSFKKWKHIFPVLRKLELGLIFVSLAGDTPFAEVALEQSAYNGNRIYSKQKKRLLSEAAGRSVSCNTGGCVGKKIATAYTEAAIQIACLLEVHGALSTRKLRELGTDQKRTTSILYKNFYGWFENVGRGVYALTKQWETEENYAELRAYYREKAAHSEQNIETP